MFISCTVRAFPCWSCIWPQVNPSDAASIILVPEEPQRMKMPQQQRWGRAKSERVEDETGRPSTTLWCATLPVSPREQAPGEPCHTAIHHPGSRPTKPYSKSKPAEFPATRLPKNQ